MMTKTRSVRERESSENCVSSIMESNSLAYPNKIDQKIDACWNGFLKKVDTSSSSVDEHESNGSQCPHVEICKALTFSQLATAKQKCQYCSFAGKNLWLCLYDSCQVVLCGQSAKDDSNAHYEMNEAHCLAVNLSNFRIWCQKCQVEVEAAGNEPIWHIGETMLCRQSVVNIQKARLRTAPQAKCLKSDRQQNKPLKQDIIFKDDVKSPNVIRSRQHREQREINRAIYQDVDMDSADSANPRGLTGLENLGNTCYLNAAVQCLSNCTPLRDYFLSMESLSHLKPVFGEMDLSVAAIFQGLIKYIWSPAKYAYANPSKLLLAVRRTCPQFRGWAQQDSQELIRCLLDLLHREMRQPIYAWQERLLQPINTNDREHSVSDSSDSSQQIMANANYETADSGCSSDTTDGRPIVRQRKMSRSRSQTGTRCSNHGGIVDGKGVSLNKSFPVSVHSPYIAPKSKMEPSVGKHQPLRYRSLITEVFDGRLKSSVQCLTCRHVSETTETFQDLSLPIPSRDQVEYLSTHYEQQDSLYDSADSIYTAKSTADTREEEKKSWPRWLYGWTVSPLVNYLYGPMVSLDDCLKAFFHPDDLNGDDMYSCDRCAKLRNGVKMCKIMKLPEVLCVHLKRFRHDATYSSKINTTVTFAVEDDLDMSLFVDRSCTDSIRTYRLTGFVTHYGGGADNGHYVAYCRNELNGNWFEFDDTTVSRVDTPEVAAKEAYVLFYTKSHSIRMDCIKSRLKLFMNGQQAAEEEMYVSGDWLHRLSTFSEPGPITNFDFLCPHGNLDPSRTRLCAPMAGGPWRYILQMFGGGPECSSLNICNTCQKEYFEM